jgi:hypothetical protein
VPSPLFAGPVFEMRNPVPAAIASSKIIFFIALLHSLGIVYGPITKVTRVVCLNSTECPRVCISGRRR